jgi:hypothetical protein
MSAIAEEVERTAKVSESNTVRVRQNWVLDPLQDSLFIIVAPLIVLLLAIWAFQHYGAAQATTLIITVHIVMTVAHHLPTFIRIYGDVDLFKRFKWSFVLGPVIPLGFSAAVLTYLAAKDLPVEYFLYLYIMLVIWDPWHFLRQHYGFMRIYDRHNAAPKKLASRMDSGMSIVWFAYAMAASGAWLPQLLNDMYNSANIPLVLSLSAEALQGVASILQTTAFAMTLLYAGYLAWCWRHGYYISWAKVALLAITFGAMYLSYVPNAWMQSLAPGWSFKVGFAVIGVVHMTQYLAIVWRYNRGLASNASRARDGWFKRWHAKGGVLIGAVYVAICLLYGEVITTQQDNRLLMSVLLAVGFTSTLLHYYFDGFIWKVRHQQNRDALAMAGGESPQKTNDASWWAAASNVTAGKMFARQLLYFGAPMTLLTLGAMAAWQTPSVNYMQHMYAAQSLSQDGKHQQAADAARSAYAAMNKQLPFLQRMTELEPTAAREAELAFLVYNQSLYEHIVMPQLAGNQPSNEHLLAHRENVRMAIQSMESAIQRGGEIRHLGREKMTRSDAQSVVDSWRRQLL